MIQDIKEFIDKYKGSDVTRSAINKFNKTIENMASWSCEKSNRNQNIKVSDDCLYNIVNFYKSFIANFVTIFPNMILNKVDYEDVIIPKYLGITKPHSNKIKKYISGYYEKLRVFYGVPNIYNILTTIQKSSKNLLKLAQETPCFTSIKYGEKIIKPVFDERTSRFLFQYYLLRIMINYIDLTDEDEMIVTEIRKETEIDDMFTVQYLEGTESRDDVIISRTKKDKVILNGNKKGLKQTVSHLLLSFFEILDNQKDVIDISYEEILDRVFKLKEKEKNMITDKLKGMSDELRDADTILKINKLGVWSKGLQKGLTTYVKEAYDEEREFRDEMDKIEKNLRSKNKNISDDELNILVDDYIEQRNVDDAIEKDAYDMSGYTEDYGDGNFEGDEVENYDDYE
jgi:hypothetical protein